MVVEELNQNEYSQWDEFVEKNDDGTFYHLTGWKELVEKVYRFKSFYLIAKENNKITGILPLFLTKDIFFGKKLISVPFAVTGGVCGESSQAEDILIEKAIELTRKLNVDYLELRQFREQPGNWVMNKNYSMLLLKLNPDTDKLWKNLQQNTRRSVRRAKEKGLEVRLESKNLDEFYELYAQGQRDFGTPIMNYKWLKDLFNNFSDHHTIATVYKDGKPIVSKFIRRFKKKVGTIFSHVLKEYRNLYPHHLLTWEIIENYSKQGYTYFDFGRTLLNTGTYKFKISWGAKPKQLNYHYYLHKAKAIPDTSHGSSKRQGLSKLWKKIPVPIANTLGPIIRRNYP